MVFKVHSRCNINCTYCYMFNKGDEAFKGMPRSVPWNVVEGVAEMIRSDQKANPDRDYALVFHGGEPLLIGVDYFRRIMDFFLLELFDVKVRFTVQTNGILIDEEWIKAFEEYSVVVSVSLDGPPHVNGRHRVTFAGTDSTPEVLRGIQKLKESKVVFPGVLSVVQHNECGREAVEYFADELELEWFDFLLPDHTYEDLPPDWDERQEGYTRFLISAFDAWYSRVNSGVSCRFFESIVSRVVGGPSTIDTIGKDGLGTIIIETNGALEPHDVLRICPEFDRASGVAVGSGAIEEFYSSPIYREAANLDQRHCDTCLSCQYFKICKGGHYIHRYKRGSGFMNPSVHCHTLKNIIEHVGNRITRDLFETMGRTSGCTPTPAPLVPRYAGVGDP